MPRMHTESMYLLCRHNRLQNGRFCEDCLEEKRLEERFGALRLCSHFNFWESCKICRDKFLAFCMATHDRLGSLVLPPQSTVHTKTEFRGCSMVVSTTVTVRNRHNAFRNLPSDIVHKIWKIYAQWCLRVRIGVYQTPGPCIGSHLLQHVMQVHISVHFVPFR